MLPHGRTNACVIWGAPRAAASGVLGLAIPAAMKSSFPKADPAATAFFHDLVPTAPNVAVRPMFGHTAAFVNGNMFLGVFGDRMLVRLAESDRTKLLAESGAGPFEPMAGRPMREYVLLPPDWQDDPSLARAWVSRSIGYAGSLPAKGKSKPKAAKSAAAATKRRLRAGNLDWPCPPEKQRRPSGRRRRSDRGVGGGLAPSPEHPDSGYFAIFETKFVPFASSNVMVTVWPTASPAILSVGGNV